MDRNIKITINLVNFFDYKANNKEYNQALLKALKNDIGHIKHVVANDNNCNLNKHEQACIEIRAIDKVQCTTDTFKCLLAIRVLNAFNIQLTFNRIGKIMLKYLSVVKYPKDKNGATKVMIYCDDTNKPLQYGTYNSDYDSLKDLISIIAPTVSPRQYNYVIRYIHARAKVVPRNDPKLENLIPVQNVIFNFKTKKTINFSPKYVFTAKLDTPYNPEASKSPVYVDNGHKWTFDKFLLQALGKEQIKTFWQFALFMFDSSHTSNKMAWFKGDAHGSNGKSTLARFLTRVIGSDKVADTSISDFGDSFGLAQLPNTVADIGDNVNSNARLDNRASDAIHSIITGDTVVCNIKNKNQFSLTYRGQLLMLSNGYPSFSDNNGMARRLLVFKFNHDFQGDSDTVKEKYSNRKPVKEYILYHALNQPYFTEISDNKVNEQGKKDLMQHSSPVIEFANTWFIKDAPDKIPASMAYHMYISWAEANKFNSNMSTRTFNNRFAPAIDKYFSKKRERVTENDCTNLVDMVNSYPWDSNQIKAPNHPTECSCYLRNKSTDNKSRDVNYSYKGHPCQIEFKENNGYDYIMLMDTSKHHIVLANQITVSQPSTDNDLPF